MTISEMLGQSAVLTLLGICVVFTFLIILIFAMTAMHGVLHALKLDKIEEPKKRPSVTKPSTSDNAVIAAIVAALHK